MKHQGELIDLGGTEETGPRLGCKRPPETRPVIGPNLQQRLAQGDVEALRQKHAALEVERRPIDAIQPTRDGRRRVPHEGFEVLGDEVVHEERCAVPAGLTKPFQRDRNGPVPRLGSSLRVRGRPQILD